MKKNIQTLILIVCTIFFTVESYNYSAKHNILFLMDNVEALTDEGDDIIGIMLPDVDITCSRGSKGICWIEKGVGGWQENAAGMIYFWPDNCEFTGYVNDFCL